MPFIHRHQFMFQHDNATPHVARIWKLKMSQFFHGLHTHQTCHPLSMSCMLWIDVYDSMFWFPPISSNVAQPLKSSGSTFHNQQPDQLYAKEICCTAWSHQILTGFLIHSPTFFIKVCEQQIHICILSHVKSID